MYPRRASGKVCLTTVGIEPATFQLGYEVKSVRMGGISELNLVPSISVSFYDVEFFLDFRNITHAKHDLAT